MAQRRLPWFDGDASFERRQVLWVLGTATATAAGVGCGAPIQQDAGSPDDAGNDGAPSSDGSDGTDAGDPGADAADDAPATCTPSGAMVGAVSNFAPNTWRSVATQRVIVGHDDNGLFAYSSTCTHQGCTVPAPPPGGVSTCRCHGAQFDDNGAVVRGPATRPLQHYAVIVCDGNVYVDTSMRVSADTRAAV